MAEISAKVTARSSIAMAPMPQEISEAGPAYWLAWRGANSQPDPIMPLIATKVRPMRPISRFIWCMPSPRV
jgi:hypothetical protein